MLNGSIDRLDFENKKKNDPSMRTTVVGIAP
jgi:hypothetical protein